MAGRPNLWGARRSLAHGDGHGRRRSDQRRLLVELELDDTLYQGSMRPESPADVWRSRMQPQASSRAINRPQSASARERPRTRATAARMTSSRVSSPSQLQQRVRSSRRGLEDAEAVHTQRQRSTHRSESPQSPAQLVVTAIRQNTRLRDQLLAQLQQELLGVRPLHRASLAERDVPQRVVRLLNKLRSVSLAVVETVVYLQTQVGTLDVTARAVLEREFLGYLLRMAASDTDFLACWPPLQRFFEDANVSLTRNPFLDGLTLDSSEVLLCSCHGSTTSAALFDSPASSSRSLFHLLTHKLEAFGLQTQRHLPGWQHLPVERVAAAILHLVDVETRYTAVRSLPSYLQPVVALTSGNTSQKTPHASRRLGRGYGTFGAESEQWPTSWQANMEDFSEIPGEDEDEDEVAVMEAWASSPVAKQSPSAPALPKFSQIDMLNEWSHASPAAVAATATASALVISSRPPTPASSRDLYSEDDPRVRQHKFGSDLESMAADVEELSRPPSLPSTPKTPSAVVSVETACDDTPESVASTHTRLPLTSPSQDTPAEVKSTTRRRSAGHRGSKKRKSSGSSRKAPVASNCMNDQDKEVIPAIDVPPKTMVVPSSSPLSASKSTQVSSSKTTGRLYAGDELPSSARSSPKSPIPSVDDQIPGILCGNTGGGAVDPALTLEKLDLESTASSNLAANTGRAEGNLDVSNVSSRCLDGELVSPCECASEGQAKPSEVIQSVDVGTEGDPACGCGSPRDASEACLTEGCDFDYSSKETIANIASALELLPCVHRDSHTSENSSERVGVSSTALLNDLEREEANKRTDDSMPTPSAVDVSNAACENILTADENFINDTHPEGEKDEFEYSADDAISSIALALQLLPQVALDKPFFNHNEQPRETTQVPAELVGEDELKCDSECPSSFGSDTFHLPSRPDGPVERILPPEIVPELVEDSEADGSAIKDDDNSLGLDRIFALCRDVQVAAYDMGHWTSEREADGRFYGDAQSPTLPWKSYGSSVATATTTSNSPRYLEREIKMLRRNLAVWREACATQKQAKLVVRRSMARRKINKFLFHRYQLLQEARRKEVELKRYLAASRLQLNWAVYRHNRELGRRKAHFRTAHMAFHRMQFFTRYRQRQTRREDAKEVILRWWRCQRSRIKRQRKKQVKLERERQRRMQASKEVQRFLKEVVLRRKLKAAQDMVKNVLFKEQLRWTKAKRDVEKRMKLDSKHRRELVAEMNAGLADLDNKWKTAEQEKLELLSHHERVVQQQQHILDRKGRKLAVLKIQMFLGVCLLHRRLQRVESEKHRCERKLREVTRSKELLDIESQQRIGRARAQTRVLQRKLGRVSEQTTQAAVSHQQTLSVYETREKRLQESAARQTIKAFVELQTAIGKSMSERQQFVLQEQRLKAEKSEQELMAQEEQLEQRRVATAAANELTERLHKLEEAAQALWVAKSQLMEEKHREAKRAAQTLEQNRVEASKKQVKSWILEQVRLSRLKRQEAEKRDAAARELTEERRRQQKEIDAKVREIASIKITGFVQHGVDQRRSHRAARLAQQQEQELSMREKTAAIHARSQVVQAIIEVKLLSELEVSRGMALGLRGVVLFHRQLAWKFTRMKELREILHARVIQRCWRRWRRQRAIKRAESMVLARIQDAKRRKDLACRIQRRWRAWAQERARRRAQDRVFRAHLESIRRRALARKIQRRWSEWHQQRQTQTEHERAANVQDACARRIQTAWRECRRRWRRREEAERFQTLQHFSALRIQNSCSTWQRRKLAKTERRQMLIQREACVRKLQRGWRQWHRSRCEREASASRIQHGWMQYRRNQQRQWEQELERQEQHASAVRIQQRCHAWWRARQREEMHVQQQQPKAVRIIQQNWRCYYQRRVEKQGRIRQEEHTNAVILQHKWRSWQRSRQHEKERQCREQEELRKAVAIQQAWTSHLRHEKRERERFRRDQELSALKIQRNWYRCQLERQKEQERRVMEEELRTTASKVQMEWRKRRQTQQEQQELVQRRQEEEKQREKREEQEGINARVIQTRWRAEKRKQQQEKERQLQQDTCAVKIQQRWRKWSEWQSKQREAEHTKQKQTALASMLQRYWRASQSRQQKALEQTQLYRRQDAAALTIQSHWRRWGQLRRENEEQLLKHAAARKIQSYWRKEQYKQEKQRQEREAERLRKEQHASSLTIQRNWAACYYRNKMEKERIRHEQDMSALKIQTYWLRWRHERQEELEKERIRQEQYEGSLKIQRSWGIWRHRRKLERERVRHLEHMSALKIQRKWHRLQNQQREAELEMKRLGEERSSSSRRHHGSGEKRLEVSKRIESPNALKQEALDATKQRSARCIARFMQGLQQRRHEEKAATAIAAIWRGKSCREELQAALEAKRAREVRLYQLQLSIFARKVQFCWGKWYWRTRKAKRAAVKAQELQLIKETKLREWRRRAATRMLAAARIRRILKAKAARKRQERRLSMQLKLEELEKKRAEKEQEVSARAIQESWRRWCQAQEAAGQLRREQEKYERLNAIKFRFCGRCIARTVKRFHRYKREEKAAIAIEALWRGAYCRQEFGRALDAKRAEETRIYLLKLSVFARKVQRCWRDWNWNVRKTKREAVKAMEMQLIENEKTHERARTSAVRRTAVRRIQRLLRAKLHQKAQYQEVSKLVNEPPQHLEVGEKHVEDSMPHDAFVTENSRTLADLDEWTRAGVEAVVDNWSYRELPHILIQSVNQVLLYHDAAKVLQSLIRGYQRRQQLHFRFQRSFSASEPGSTPSITTNEHFHFHFGRASAWLEWGTGRRASVMGVGSSALPLRLRFDAGMTRKLLQMFDPHAVHSTLELQQTLHEIAIDALPLFRSPACQQSNSHPKREQRYLEVEELELPHFMALMRQMGRRRSQAKREVLVGVDHDFSPASSSQSSPLATQRTNRELTIFDAVENASVEDAVFLQQRGVDLGELEPKTGRNALHLLTFSTENYRFRVEMLAFLLRSVGSGNSTLDVNAADCNGDTPVLLYAAHGHLEFLQTLIEHGANVEAVNAKGQNVLHCACEEDQVEICAMLHQRMMTSSVVEDSAEQDDSEATTAVSSLHVPDYSGRFPLHILAEKGFLECAKQLVVQDDENVEWNSALQYQGDAQGRTALHLAVLSHDVAMTAFLLQPGGGANVNAYDDLHRSPLHFAVNSPAALPLISRLAQHGADLNVADERGDTPLHWAAFSGRAAVALHLLALGADPTAVNGDWETPAQISAAYGQLDCMRLLLQAQKRREAAMAADRERFGGEQQSTHQSGDKTALQRLEEAVNHLHSQQASEQVNYDPSSDTTAALAEHGGYWAELHQEVQLVEESGQFSSEDEETSLLFDDDPRFLPH